MPTKSNNIGGQGGARPGAGRKKSAVKEKAENGNPGGRPLEVLNIPEVEGVEMPKPHDFLSAEQRDGSELQAKEIYEETWKWLKQIWLITLLANQSILVHNITDKEHPKDLLTEDEVEILTSPFELAGYKAAITAAMHAGTKRNVESEEDSKNAQVG